MVSIIIPVYNAERYLGECIESVLNQTYSDFELILVDDGSEDCSYQICKEYADKDERIKNIKKKNGGVSSARYTGLQEAKGEYISFMDNDDMFLPEFLETSMGMFDEHTDIVVTSFANVISERMKPYMMELKQPEIQNVCFSGMEASEEIEDFSTYPVSVTLWGKIYRKDFLLKLHLEKYADRIPTLYFEDVFALHILLSNARKVKFSNQIVYLQRTLKDSQSRNGKLGIYYFEQIDSFDLLYQYLKDKELPKSKEHCINIYDKTLERTWYKLKHDGITYDNMQTILNKIDEKYGEYYQYFLNTNCGVLRKMSMRCFANHRLIWEKTFGFFYFKFISKIIRKRFFASVEKN